jgi:RNA polymerase-binding transcription factor DksA
MATGGRKKTDETPMVERARSALEARRSSLVGPPLTEAARAELKELEAALQRIEEGQWGRCEKCGGAMGRDRLRALPEVRTCLSCSTLRP